MVLFSILALPAQADAAKRPLDLQDFDRLLVVEGVACSSDGAWIAYTVEGSDLEADERKNTIWMVNYEGTQDVRLSGAGESATKPKFSPDGRYVSFLAARGADSTAQIYLLDRRGGEAQPITHVSGEIADYSWSADGSRLVISMSAGEEAAGASKKPKPIVIDRLHFKEDISGYLTAEDRDRLYLLDVTSREITPLTREPGQDDTKPVWSPDGKSIAFFSNRGVNQDRAATLGLYVIDARPGAEARKLTEFYEPYKPSLSWSPNGTHLLYATGLAGRMNAYSQDQLSLLSVADGKSKTLADRLDRALISPAFLTDDRVEAILEDDGSAVPVEVRLDTGSIDRRIENKRTAANLCAAGGHIVVTASTDSAAQELYALEGSGLRKLTAHTDDLVNGLALGPVEDIAFPSRDGAVIHGMLVKPWDYQPGKLYPTIVWIHGGPNSQDTHSLDLGSDSSELERQWFAAHGYVVLAVNYRASGGRGSAFSGIIAADWGDKEVMDVLAAADYAVKAKIADPHRLGIGGWSYGGILTDYTIASDSRFKAAISGAGAGNQLTMYGGDEYILQYNSEIEPPWRSLNRWLKISYPLLHADRIKTPTLFLGGDQDFNVPIIGGEQMYAALATQRIPAQLIVYPGQNHVLTRPSFIKDCMRRYVEWFDRYLKPAAD